MPRAWPQTVLMSHMDECRRARLAQYRALPAPYDASDVLRPKVPYLFTAQPKLPLRGSMDQSLDYAKSTMTNLPAVLP